VADGIGDGKIILKLAVKKQDTCVWAGFILMRTGGRGGHDNIKASPKKAGYVPVGWFYFNEDRRQSGTR
jgi:hypothetical protein